MSVLRTRAPFALLLLSAALVAVLMAALLAQGSRASAATPMPSKQAGQVSFAFRCATDWSDARAVGARTGSTASVEHSGDELVAGFGTVPVAVRCEISDVRLHSRRAAHFAVRPVVLPGFSATTHRVGGGATVEVRTGRSAATPALIEPGDYAFVIEVHTANLRSSKRVAVGVLVQTDAPTALDTFLAAYPHFTG